MTWRFLRRRSARREDPHEHLDDRLGALSVISGERHEGPRQDRAVEQVEYLVDVESRLCAGCFEDGVELGTDRELQRLRRRRRLVLVGRDEPGDRRSRRRFDARISRPATGRRGSCAHVPHQT
jgi:hypothetical protein